EIEVFFAILQDMYNLCGGVQSADRRSGRLALRAEPSESASRDLEPWTPSEAAGRELVSSVQTDLLTMHRFTSMPWSGDKLPLDVARIEFSSPGFADVAGFGAVVGHMKDLIVKVIDLVTTREKRELET